MTSEQDFSRYHRQMLLPGVGQSGQQRLRDTRVLIVGVGALGCAVADLLARAGVGSLWLLDRDLVDWTNLQRQTLFDEDDAKNAAPKAAAAAARLSRVNSQIEIRPLVRDLTPTNAEQTLLEAQPHVLVDGTDNFETRYLLNDLSVKHSLPFVYGGAVGTRGLCATFVPGSGPCLRCVFEEPPPPGSSPTCDTAGVLGAVIGAVASRQAADVIRLIVQGGQVKDGEGFARLTEMDLWSHSHRVVNLRNAKRADCPCCGLRRFEYLLGDGADSATLCGQDAVQVSPRAGVVMDLKAMGERLAAHGTVHVSRFFVRLKMQDRGAPLEITVFPDARAIIRGTTNPQVARSVYARLVGS